METLDLLPDQESYSFTEYAPSYISTAFDGPLSFYSARAVQPYKFTCQWTLDDEEFEEFVTFFKARKADQQEFLIPLISSSGRVQPHKVQFLFDTYSYPTNAYGMHVVSCSLVGAVLAGMVLTSVLYPAVVEEAFQTGGTITTGVLQSQPRPQDNFDASFRLLNGELRAILQSTGPYDDNEFAVAFNLGNGEIRQILKSTDQGFEEFQASMALGNGTLKTVLISSTYDPVEQFQVGFSITSGILE